MNSKPVSIPSLQWGRGHVTAEIRSPRGNADLQDRFNGAAAT